MTNEQEKIQAMHEKSGKFGNINSTLSTMTKLEEHLNYTKKLLDQVQKQIRVKREALKEADKIEAQLIKDQIDLLEEFYNKNK